MAPIEKAPTVFYRSNISGSAPRSERRPAVPAATATR